MAKLEQPFWKAIEGANTILLAGCGGGYDVFCGLPLYFALREMGKTVHLANYSFSSVYSATGRRVGSGCVKITWQSISHDRYFPELHLARWFHEQGEDVPIYCFDGGGVLPFIAAYQGMIDETKLDAIILVDGGTDSLMRGDEAGLGTPQEDMTSIAAVHTLDVPIKLLVCLGFGIDTFHGVCHVQFLEAVADITKAGGFLGAWALTPDMPEAQRYKSASDYVFQQMPNHPSIVSSSILSAIEGQFGDYHTTRRTESSTLFINPLMTLYWAFQLEAVAKRILYLDELYSTQTPSDVHDVIDRLRETHVLKPWQNLPM